MAELKVKDLEKLSNEELFEQLNSLVVGIDEEDLDDLLYNIFGSDQEKRLKVLGEIKNKRDHSSYVIDWNDLLGRESAEKLLEALMVERDIIENFEFLEDEELKIPGEEWMEEPEVKPEVKESAKKKVKKLTEVAEMNEEQLVEKLGGDHAIVVNSVGESLRAAAQIALGKIKDRKNALKQKAEDYRRELTSELQKEIDEVDGRINELNAEIDDINGEIKKVENEISDLNTKLKRNEKSINLRQGKVDKEEEAKEQVANNTKALVKLEKKGMLKRIFSRFVEKFLSSPTDALTEEDKSKIISGELEMPEKKGIFATAKEAVKEEKDSIAQNQENDREEGEKQEQIIQNKIDKLERELNGFVEKRDALEDKRSDAFGRKAERNKEHERAIGEIDEMLEESQFLTDEQERIENMSRGKLLVKRTLRDIKKAFGFGKEREVGEDR